MLTAFMLLCHCRHILHSGRCTQLTQFGFRTATAHLVRCSEAPDAKPFMRFRVPLNFVVLHGFTPMEPPVSLTTCALCRRNYIHGAVGIRNYSRLSIEKLEQVATTSSSLPPQMSPAAIAFRTRD